MEQILKEREMLGITGPEPVPHPDDIIVDCRTGEVWVMGPLSEEEKSEIEYFKNNELGHLEDENYLIEMLKNSTQQDKEMIQEQLSITRSKISILRKIIDSLPQSIEK